MIRSHCPMPSCQVLLLFVLGRYWLGVAPVTTRGIMFLLGDPELNLHFPLLLGGGHIQGAGLSIILHRMDSHQHFCASEYNMNCQHFNIGMTRNVA